MAENKDKDLESKIKNCLKEILYDKKNKIFKLKDISIIIQNKIDTGVNIKKIESKLKNIKYAPKNCHIEKIGGFFYIYHEDDEQKKIKYEVKQKIFLNILKECLISSEKKDRNHDKYSPLDGINQKKISENIDLIMIAKLFLDEFKKIDTNKEKISKLYDELNMNILLPLSIHDNTDNILYETIKNENQELYELSIKSLNYNYIQSEKNSYFDDQIFKEDPKPAIKKIRKNALISAFIILITIAFKPEIFVTMALFFAIPIYCIFSGGLKKGCSRLFISWLIYIMLSSNSLVLNNISLLKTLPETWLPDINIFIISFIITNIILNYSHYFIKLFNSLLFIINTVVYNRTQKNIDLKIHKFNNYWKKIDIEIQKIIKKFFQRKTNQNNVSSVINFFNKININIQENLFEKNPFTSISLIRYLCTMSLISLFYNTVFYDGTIKNEVIKNYAIENKGFCKNNNINEKSLIVKLKNNNDKVFLYDGEKFNKTICEN